VFESVMIVNRGEIAQRVIRTATRMGIRTIAVHSAADTQLPYVREAASSPAGITMRRSSRGCDDEHDDGAAPALIAGPGREEVRVTEVRAEMVANVWKVVAAEGSAVADGDTLVILESMKMEIPVLAEDSGTLTKLAVSEGDVVQEGDLIAVIE
jgi:acetyl-CoA carboxylase biotin carboxyl carrier protein